ncbi:MAG: polysaccharide biosynthesis/export family protein [Myxococcales bacterium]|nr:polysaccharide export protein [Myxococcota bacterium]MDW8280734.1 polysaccharide biosynthesis/export family protein [Myxococcales bacterium]
MLILAACHPAARREPALSIAEQTALLEQDSTLGVGDVFEVRVYGESELSAKYRVGADGTIDFPLIGNVKVAGLLPSQVAAHIADRLRDGILRSPQVSVYVHEHTSKKIHVIGQVARPGTFPYTAGMNIVEAITQAGGFTPVSAKNGTTVTRIENGRKVIYHVRVGDIGDGLAANFQLRPGDIISVPERFF